jgi:hypothetical protein
MRRSPVFMRGRRAVPLKARGKFILQKACAFGSLILSKEEDE